MISFDAVYHVMFEEKPSNISCLSVPRS